MSNKVYNSNSSIHTSVEPTTDNKTVRVESSVIFEALYKAMSEYYSQELSRKIKEGIRKSKERKATLQNAKTNENEGVSRL